MWPRVLQTGKMRKTYEIKEIRTIFVDCGKAEHEECEGDDKKVVGETGAICRLTSLTRRVIETHSAYTASTAMIRP